MVIPFQVAAALASTLLTLTGRNLEYTPLLISVDTSVLKFKDTVIPVVVQEDG